MHRMASDGNSAVTSAALTEVEAGISPWCYGVMML